MHITCSTKIKAELVFTRKRIAAGKEEGKKMVSAGLMATHQKKLDRYALLAALKSPSARRRTACAPLPR